MFSLWKKKKPKTIEEIRRERHLKWLQHKNSCKIQNWYRCMYKKRNISIIRIQCAWRCYVAREIVKLEREELEDIASTAIQSVWRGLCQRRTYKNRYNQIIKLQSIARMYLERKKYRNNRNNMIIIQSILRRRVVQNRYRNILALHRNNRIHHNRVFNEIRIRNREITEENNNHIAEINRRIQEIRENTIDRMNDIAMPRNDTPALSGLNQYMNNRGVTRAVNTSILDNMVLINNRTSNNRHIDRLPNRVGNTVVNNNRQDLGMLRFRHTRAPIP